MKARMSRSLIAVLAICFSNSSHPQWRDDSLGGMLNNYVRMLAEQCPQHAAAMADAKAKGDTGVIIVTRQMYQTMCVCHPAKARELLESLPKAALSAQAIGDNEFKVHATPAIQQACWKEPLEQMYAGEGCDGYWSTDMQKGVKQAEFCSCMKEAVEGWQGAEVGAVFAAMGPYNSRFRWAKANKTAFPLRPPQLNRYIGSLTRCGGGEEFRE